MIAQARMCAMDERTWMRLLGGLTPSAFMRRHWQRKPLLVRGAWPGVQPPVDRHTLFELAARDGVESRLVARDGERWVLRRGPLPRRALPPLARPRWTLLVQGLDLHVDAARAMLERFRFVPDARLDDVMVSFATDGGGVGPHVDDYDVFLVQVAGVRRWRLAPVRDAAFVEGLPLKILRRFEPEVEWSAEPGDLLYLPPRWGHDGVAAGECMTCSIGFRSAARDELAADLLAHLADFDANAPGPLYRDPAGSATAHPGRIPGALQDFAHAAVKRAARRRDAVERALGESLSEPKPAVWFDGGRALRAGQGVRLDRRTRMLYDACRIYINGEAYDSRGRDAALMRRLADARALGAADLARLGQEAIALVDQWARAGWVHARSGDDGS
jgi:50S ribosomal protein L16 3-hydroxylase